MRTALWRQFVVSVRLQLRNPAALAYSYAIPLVFFAAFWTLYRHESPPLARHLGQLLTITALSGACFALPAWLVSDRERGVWRQYRLAPVPGVVHLAGMIGASYLLLLSAGALQLAAAAVVGAPVPAHPFQLWLAFTLACAAFLGIGLLITMIGDTVPAAQALGQTVFLPMLILGGVAVPLSSVPDWVQQVAAVLPGRYAVDAIDGALSGSGFERLTKNAAVLAIMAATSGLAALAIFRWESGQRIGVRRAIVPVALAAAAWIAVGAILKPGATRELAAVATSVQSPSAVDPPTLDRPRSPSPSQAAPALSAVEGPALNKVEGPAPSKVEGPALSKVEGPAPSTVEQPGQSAAEGRTWRDVTMDDVDVNLVFVGLPPDHGVVTPINTEYRRREDVECIRSALVAWTPAGVDDVVQRARNVLLLAAVADLLQLEIEHDVPIAVFDHLQQKVPKDQLIKVLYWIATHPSEGHLDALDHLAAACLDVQPPDDTDQIRERISIYALKLLGRITGKIRQPFTMKQ